MLMANAVAMTLAPSVALAAATARAEPPAIERSGLYVVATDLERATGFYEKLFGKAPAVRAPGLVGFDVAGGLYAVVAKDRFAKDATVGGNVVPYIRVADIDAWFAHVRAIVPGALVSPAVLREGPVSLFKFRDPDGNQVELFSVGAPG